MAEISGHEKAPLQSKKFVAFLVAEVSTKIALIVLIALGMSNSKIDIIVGSIALAMLIIAGAIEALYIGGQAGLDKYTRIALIASTAGHSFKMGNVSVTAEKKPEPKPDAEIEG